MLRHGALSLLLVASGLSGLSCGGDGLAPPTAGTIQISSSTSGAEQDADGYTVQMDAGSPQAIGTAATLTTSDVTPGDHTLRLGEVAANCTVAGDNPRTVTVTAGEVATVGFVVTCNATTGSLSVTSSTSGPSPDVDGYSISVNGLDRGSLGVNGAVTISGLVPGSYTVGLSGLADNCQIQGDNLRAVTITAGADASVAYAIVCAAPPPNAGSVRVTTATSGPDPDADGYTVAADGGAGQPIAVSKTTTLTNLAAGVHSVQLGGVAGNCTVQGTNPRSVTVTAGGTAEVSFVITCSATTGTIRVSVTTSGSPTDPDGYTAKLDGADPGKSVAVGGNVSFTGVPAGSHAVALTGVAVNCTIAGGASHSTTVTAGAMSEVAFVVTCAPTTGSIKVTTATTGFSLDADDYTISVDGGALQGIDINATLTTANVAPGDHTVTLGGLASNCTVAGTNPRTVTVTAGSEASVTFNVSCIAAWRSISLPPGFVGSAIWASSPSDLFVVGRYQSEPVTDPRRVLLRYDGRNWSDELSGENGSAGPGAVWGTSPTNVYAAGEEKVWQYDGTNWTSIHDGNLGDFLEYLAIWGTSARDLFIVGFFVEAENEGPMTGLIDHYDGSTWSQTIKTSVANGGEQAFVDFHDVAGSSPTDVYALARHVSYHYDENDNLDGTGEVDHAVWHNNGSGWSLSHNIVAPTGGSRERPNLLTAVWANARDDVFVVGLDGRILHFNGTAWLPMTSGTSQDLTDVWGNSGSNVYAVGEAGIMHYDGTRWSVINTAKGNRVWGVGVDVFVIGQGSILHATP